MESTPGRSATDRNSPRGASALLDLIARPAWMADAACREHPEIDFFPTQGEPCEPAKVVCEGCLVQAECLAVAVENDETFGIWGGLSARQRRKLRRRPAA